ncbi:SubName: Full=Uncharacterized protein {ECO:0000313/EMBL:CCA76805.1} [Serendipita indica DSM 11827]|nr:SubName: Full=Uncharacterized protein {ECO:0000313/EMBL:CCA76805.1} [Serendipita indica DSM 11827]
MNPVQVSSPELMEVILSVHKLYEAQYSKDKDFYDNLLLRDTGFFLRQGHIKVVTPTELLQDIPSQKYNLSPQGMRRKRKVFLSCLDDIKSDQRRRERAKDKRALAQSSSVNTEGLQSTRSGGADKRKPEPEMELEDADMYAPLICAFNAACPPPRPLRGEKMRCCDIGSSDLPLATSIKVLPDLALSFDYQPNGTHDVFLHPAVYIEIKADEVFDLPFQKAKDFLKDHELTDSPKQLLLQVLRYVNLGQASELPWDYLYFITITGSIARIWKFTHTGCIVTTPSRCLESPTRAEWLLAVEDRAERAFSSC